MKKFRLIPVAILILAIIGAAWIIRQQTAPFAMEIELRSNPYPLTTGPTMLIVSLRDADGRPVDGATVQIQAQMEHFVSLPIVGHSSESSKGDYPVPIMWPIMGPWQVDIMAQLPTQQATLREQYEVFVYPMTPDHEIPQTAFQSVREMNAMISNPVKEMWIVIPQGTNMMMMTGQFDDVLIPSEIHLKVSGQNTLVIRNNDITDHTIGPFYVRSGETVRQQFNQPAVFQGICTIGFINEISIVVEE